MFLDEYHQISDGEIRITPTQASRFAREIAGDYNPIHDPDARRFCVPGDLLFALILHYCGLHERMTFRFRDMLTGPNPLLLPDTDDATIRVADSQGRTYVEVERGGAVIRDPERIAAFTRHYVSFSGRNFPHFLHPLLAREGVMFNPDRPLVIYDSMGFELSDPGRADPFMELSDSRLDVAG
ncbi:MAG TPA: DUF3581 family protein, partial [Gammaproteobacteria bacterium]|nr:DUF3581 family protein [Gammaproteobacteria bacterium]